LLSKAFSQCYVFLSVFRGRRQVINQLNKFKMIVVAATYIEVTAIAFCYKKEKKKELYEEL
jgi:hypothetical protein